MISLNIFVYKQLKDPFSLPATPMATSAPVPAMPADAADAEEAPVKVLEDAWHSSSGNMSSAKPMGFNHWLNHWSNHDHVDLTIQYGGYNWCNNCITGFDPQWWSGWFQRERKKRERWNHQAVERMPTDANGKPSKKENWYKLQRYGDCIGV